MNHTPIFMSGSVNRKADALRLPMRLRVNMPLGVGEAGGCWVEGPIPG